MTDFPQYSRNFSYLTPTWNNVDTDNEFILLSYCRSQWEHEIGSVPRPVYKNVYKYQVVNSDSVFD